MKNKYNLGDRVFRIKCAGIVCEPVTGIAIIDGKVYYDFQKHDKYFYFWATTEEKNVYFTKEELIKELN